MATHKENVANVVGTLRGFKLPITCDELERPTYQRVCHIYEWFLIKLTNCPYNALSQLPFSALGCFEHPEIHEHSAQTLSMCLSLNNVLMDTGFHEPLFVTDFTCPKPKKTVRMFQHLCDVYRSRLDHSGTVDDFLQRANYVKDEISRLEMDNEQLKERIYASRVLLAEREPLVTKLTERLESLDAEFRGNRDRVRAVDKNGGALDDKIKIVDAKLGSLTRECERKRDENRHLEGQIVSSPERMISEADRLERDKQMLSDDVGKLNSEAVEYDDEKMKMGRIDSLMNSITTPFELIYQDKERLDALQQESSEVVNQIVKIRSQVQAMIVKSSGKRKVLEARDAGFQSSEHQAEKRKNEMLKELDELEERLAALNRGKFGNSESAALDEACDSLRKAIQEEENGLMRFEQMIKTSYESIFKLVKEREESVRQNLEGLNKQLKKELNM